MPFVLALGLGFLEGWRFCCLKVGSCDLFASSLLLSVFILFLPWLGSLWGLFLWLGAASFSVTFPSGLEFSWIVSSLIAAKNWESWHASFLSPSFLMQYWPDLDCPSISPKSSSNSLCSEWYWASSQPTVRSSPSWCSYNYEGRWKYWSWSV